MDSSDLVLFRTILALLRFSENEMFEGNIGGSRNSTVQKKSAVAQTGTYPYTPRHLPIRMSKPQ